MLRRFYFIAAASSLAAFSMSSFAIDGASVDNKEYPAQDAINIDVDSLATKALEAFQVPGVAVGIVVDGKVLLAKGYGYRDIEKQLPVTDRTLFAIGSCTKAFTTFVVSQLAEEGKLSWDDPVIKYIPEFSVQDPLITPRLTLRDLAAHRSGLPRHDLLWAATDLTRAEVVQRIAFLPLSCDLREKFQYNNLMYIVLGTVVERVTHQSWEEVVTERILSPLLMNRTNFSIDDFQKEDDFSLPYSKNREKIIPVHFHKMNSAGPAGSINSCIGDMVRWLQLQLSDGTVFNRHFLQKSDLHELHTIQMPVSVYPEASTFDFGYGLGWGTGVYKGHYCIAHTGGIDGFTAYVGFLPLDGIGVVVLTNSDKGDLVLSSISRTIFDAFLHVNFEDWILKLKENPSPPEESLLSTEIPTKTLDAITFDEYLGTYEHLGYGIVTVQNEKDGPHIHFSHLDIPLHHDTSDIFSGKILDPAYGNSKVTIQFLRDLHGSIIGVRLPLEKAIDPMVFAKKPPQELSSREYLEKFQGTYESESLSFEISLRGDKLVMTSKNMPMSKLEAVKPFVFAIQKDETFRLTFEKDRDGRVQRAVCESADMRCECIAKNK